MKESSLTFENNKVVQLIGKENFQPWKQQGLLSVLGYNLESHLLGTDAIRQFVRDADGIDHLKPAYAKFVQLDNSLVS